MKELSRIVWVLFGIMIGFAFAIGMKNIPTAVAGNDRHEDFVMATGPVLVSTNAPTDGVWLLDYKSVELHSYFVQWKPCGAIHERRANLLVRCG